CARDAFYYNYAMDYW
nr:immunoglobulin heavy chain junction region [Mus musculus]MBK4190003.1 immunoglobulin heavy chain junction region [Mus musculus]